jgi:GNAT superfamily N-acetyltransferase
MDFFTDYDGPNDAATGPAAGVLDVAEAAYERGRLVGNVGGESEAMARAYRDLNATIKKTYNIDLPNPVTDWDRWDAETGWRKFRSVPRDLGAHIDALRGWHANKVVGLKAQNPALFDSLGLGESIDDKTTAMMRGAEKRLQDVAGRAGGIGGFAGQAIGGAQAMIFDPVQVGTMAIGGGGTVARRLIGAAIGAATGEAVSYPLTIPQKDRAGVETGAGDFVQSVGTAALFGVGVQGAGEIAGAALRGARRVIAPPDTPEARLADVVKRDPETARKAMAGDVEAEKTIVDRAALTERADVRGERAAADADELVERARPAAIDDVEHARTVNDTIRAIETGSPMPVMPNPALDGPPVIGRALDAPAGSAFDYLGKPVERRTVDPAQVQFQPETFQYKLNGDARGVRPDYASVQQWDNLAAQAIMAFEASDGRVIVADGHQRTGLAQRLMSAGHEQAIAMEAYVFREADGWTPGEVRALATRRNLQMGTGDATDTATALREMPHILDRTVRRGTEHMRTAQGLAKLDDEVFRMVRAGALPQSTGRVIGDKLTDAAQQRAAADAVLRLNLKGEETIAAFIDELKASNVRQDTTFDLFGDQAITRSLAVEMADLKVRVADLLKSNARAFKRVNEAADMLETRANVIARNTNERVASSSGEAARVLGMLSLDPGPLRDILTEGAGRIAAGEKAATIARDTANKVADLAEREGLAGLMPRPPATVDGIKAVMAKVDDPVGPQAKAQADLMARQMPEDTGSKDLIDAIPGHDDAGNASAPRTRADVMAEIKQIEQETDLFNACIGKAKP